MQTHNRLRMKALEAPQFVKGTDTMTTNSGHPNCHRHHRGGQCKLGEGPTGATIEILPHLARTVAGEAVLCDGIAGNQ
jgi:hypothetical protein